MEKREKSLLRRLTEKLYGGLNMSWPAVLLFAVATAVLTAVFLIVPIFKNSSFARMGVTFEAWIFFAILIMANCEKPLESALKTFVFFLVSQPLIYLIQVPFSDLGWELFSFYRYWFIWTLLTFPMAFVGWYIRRRDWLSLLILAPILYMLTSDYVGCFQTAAKHFPRLLVTALFCLGQVLLYLYVFTEKLWQRLLGFVLPLAAVLLVLLLGPGMEIDGNSFLPDDPVLSPSAVVEMGSPEGDITVSMVSTEDGMVRVHATAFGTADFVIRDGDAVYAYTVEVYEDGGGHSRTRITPSASPQE